MDYNGRRIKPLGRGTKWILSGECTWFEVGFVAGFCLAMAMVLYFGG